jgi:hypothetical protein
MSGLVLAIMICIIVGFGFGVGYRSGQLDERDKWRWDPNHRERMRP